MVLKASEIQMTYILETLTVNLGIGQCSIGDVRNCSRSHNFLGPLLLLIVTLGLGMFGLALGSLLIGRLEGFEFFGNDRRFGMCNWFVVLVNVQVEVIELRFVGIVLHVLFTLVL